MILDRTYDSSGLADITRLVISNLRTSKYVIRAPLTTTISDTAYISKIKIWKESTSKSPLSLHLLITMPPWLPNTNTAALKIAWRKKRWIQNSQQSDLHTLHSQITHSHMDIPSRDGAQSSMS
jgi:hypothetical protein